MCAWVWLELCVCVGLVGAMCVRVCAWVWLWVGVGSNVCGCSLKEFSFIQVHSYIGL